MSGRSPRWFTGIQYPYEANFADNTWAQIIAACQKKRIPSTWKVADQKAMPINGTYYLIDIIGFDHDEYTDGSGKAPITFQMHDCYVDKKAMNSSNTNAGGWASCSMRTTHLPDILSKMPTEVRSSIREVNKLTSAGNKSSAITTTADKLFLLREVEIFGSTTYSVAGEGTQYDYYKAGNSTVKKRDGSPEYWWESSPRAGTTSFFCMVNSDGSVYNITANRASGVAFGFCF